MFEEYQRIIKVVMKRGWGFVAIVRGGGVMVSPSELE